MADYERWMDHDPDLLASHYPKSEPDKEQAYIDLIIAVQRYLDTTDDSFVALMRTVSHAYYAWSPPSRPSAEAK